MVDLAVTGTGNNDLPYGRQSIDESDIEAVAAVLRSDRLTTGPMVEAFERAFAQRVGAAEAAACANGTGALHLAAMALRLGPGDHVVVPAITFLATANAARFVGAEVIFADVDPDTGLMLPKHLEAALKDAKGKRVKAVVSVHLNGQCGDPAGLESVARRHGLTIVEDACHALGASYGGEHTVGACVHADLATFSFHPVKTITTGEGGMVTGKEASLVDRVRLLRNHGMIRSPASAHAGAIVDAAESDPWHYNMPELGFNYRLSDIHCALGLSQLQRLDKFLTQRAELVQRYRHCLSDLSPIVRPIPQRQDCRPGWHLFVVLIDFEALGVTRGQLMHALKRRGVGSQVHYIPLYRQPYYRNRYGNMALPGAEAYYTRCLSLPLFTDMRAEDVERVTAALRELVRRSEA